MLRTTITTGGNVFEVEAPTAEDLAGLIKALSPTKKEKTETKNSEHAYRKVKKSTRRSGYVTWTAHDTRLVAQAVVDNATEKKGVAIKAAVKALRLHGDVKNRDKTAISWKAWEIRKFLNGEKSNVSKAIMKALNEVDVPRSVPIRKTYLGASPVEA